MRTKQIIFSKTCGFAIFLSTVGLGIVDTVLHSEPGGNLKKARVHAACSIFSELHLVEFLLQVSFLSSRIVSINYTKLILGPSKK